MSFSRQQLYAAGEPFGDAATRTLAGHTRYGGGGGSSSPKNYAGLEKLYQEQAASARLLREQAEKNLPGAVDRYVGQVDAITGADYAGKQASMAASDMASANAMERAATTRELASMGVNPNDPRFAGSLRGVETSNAGRMAAGQNVARNDAQKFQLGVAQDAVGTFTGQSNSAAAQMSSASSGLSNLANQQQQAQANKQAQQQQNVANTVGGGMALWSMLKDGGRVRRPGGAKRLERHMLGGQTGAQQKTQQGFFPVHEIAPPLQMAQGPQPPQGPSMQQVAGTARKFGGDGALTDRMAAKGAENTDKFGRLAGKFNADAGNQISSRAAGMRMTPEQTEAAAKAYETAAAQAADPSAAQSYLDAAANMRAGAGLEGTATPAATAATPAATTAATAAAEGGLAATAPGVAGEVGAMASGAGAAGTAGAAAGTTAGTASTLGTIAPGVSSAVGGAASGAGAGAALGTGAAAGGAAAGAGGAAAAGGLGAAAGAIGVAMPWVGAALAVGSLLGAWKDGGAVKGEGGEDAHGAFSRAFARAADNPAQDLRNGAEVEGPGDHTADVVPALVSDDEHVMNAEAAALVGHDRLEKINQEGLQLRKGGLLPEQIRGIPIPHKEVA